MDTQFSPQSVKVGIVHPGKMGATLAYALKKSGHQVYWASEGRSELTKTRAQEFDLVDLGSISALLSECDVVFSIVNGGWCTEFAALAANAEYQGIFVDANGLWGKESEEELSNVLLGAGVDYVEAGLYGWPYPGREGYTDEHTMYLSGDKADVVKALFTDGYWTVEIHDKSAKAVKRERNDQESDPREESKDEV